MLYKYKQKKKNHIDRYEKKKKDARRQIGVKGVEKEGKKDCTKGFVQVHMKKREKISKTSIVTWRKRILEYVH